MALRVLSDDRSPPTKSWSIQVHSDSERYLINKTVQQAGKKEFYSDLYMNDVVVTCGMTSLTATCPRPICFLSKMSERVFIFEITSPVILRPTITFRNPITFFTALLAMRSGNDAQCFGSRVMDIFENTSCQ